MKIKKWKVKKLKQAVNKYMNLAKRKNEELNNLLREFKFLAHVKNVSSWEIISTVDPPEIKYGMDAELFVTKTEHQIIIRIEN